MLVTRAWKTSLDVQTVALVQLRKKTSGKLIPRQKLSKSDKKSPKLDRTRLRSVTVRIFQLWHPLSKGSKEHLCTRRWRQMTGSAARLSGTQPYATLSNCHRLEAHPQTTWLLMSMDSQWQEVQTVALSLTLDVRHLEHSGLRQALASTQLRT